MKNNQSNSVVDGANYLWRGFSLIFQPGLRAYVIIPLIINILLFAGLLAVNIHYFHLVVEKVDSFLPQWLHWLNSLLWIVFVVAFVVVLTYVFSLVANLVAAPFNGFLSEKVEQLVTGKSLEQGTWKEFIRDLPRIFARQLQIIWYYLPKAILLLLCFVIPIVHIFASFLWLIFNAWMMALQYVDYPMDNHRVSFRNMRSYLAERRLMSLGFGGMAMVMSLIPIVNFIVMPAATAGATLMYVEQLQSLTDEDEKATVEKL